MSEKFPSGQDRKKVLAENAEKTSEFKQKEKKAIKIQYSWLDSSLDKIHPYMVPFSSSFLGLLRKNESKKYISLKNYIETALEEKKGNAVGVEFGGVGTNLFSDFSPGFFKKSFGVTLVDHRDEAEKLEKEKEFPKHVTLEGDIFSDETYKKLSEMLKNTKVDLIIERMGGGLEYVPPEPYTVAKILNKWYEMLNEKGLMMVQTPIVFNKVLTNWAKEIKKHRDVIDFEYVLGEANGNIPASSFRLQKLKGAPKDLPYLDPRTLSKIPMNNHW